jgi:hypothetical protein
MALASLVFGILAFLTVCNFLFIPSIIAIVTGVLARGQINRSGGLLTGSGMATAGIVLGILGALFLCALNIGVFVLNPDVMRALQPR